jgi:di/tricarboxylate transporter
MQKFRFCLLFLLVCTSFFILQGQEASFPATATVKEAQQSLGLDGLFTILVFILTFVALVAEWRPPEITMLVSSSILLIVGILTPGEFLAGFSNDILMTIAMLCIVARTLEVNGILSILSEKMLSQSTSTFRQLSSLCFPVAAASAFVNNTPLVLLMTPVVRKWALKMKKAPSIYLIPLSFSALLGGVCTLIGTSTNLVVYGLLTNNGYEGFSFFELGKVGVPCALLGIFYIVTVGYRFLPERQDAVSIMEEETREFTAEFEISEECSLVNKKIKEASTLHFKKEMLVQVERNETIIDAPSFDFTLFTGDRVVFVGDIHQIAELHEIKGLKSLADPHFKLDATSSHFAEIVLSNASRFLGKTLKQVDFRTNYGASVIAVYRQGWRVMGSVRDIVLQAGDSLMLLTGEPWVENRRNKDFYFIRHHEKLQIFNKKRAVFILATAFLMVLAASLGTPILIASIVAAFIFLFSKSISFREAQNSVVWDVLLLIACSFAFGQAIVKTNVAMYFGQILLTLVGSEPHVLIASLLLVTIICTDFMSNNAAALILFPIALQLAKLAGYNSPEAIKALAVTIAVGASTGYSIPIGYQTHMIVYGLGGYKFTDFLKIGIPLELLVWISASLLIPYFWPMVSI